MNFLGHHRIILRADTASEVRQTRRQKAQILLCAAKVSAACGGSSEPEQGQRPQNARGAQAPKHDAGTATRDDRAFLERRWRTAAVGAVRKAVAVNCAVVP